MTGWVAKRFWTTAEARPCPGGFTVMLDARGLKTPAKTDFVVPTEALARAVAAEWQAQEGQVRPEIMPFTRMANSAIVKVPAMAGAVVDELLRYGDTDLLCYRAEAPEALVARQAALWDPELDWAEARFGARLRVTGGVMPVTQPPEALAALRRPVERMDAFALTAFHDFVGITGSLVLALGLAEGRHDAGRAFDLSRLDEHWQQDLWGTDEDAARTEAAKRRDLADASRFFQLSAA